MLALASIPPILLNRKAKRATGLPQWLIFFIAFTPYIIGSVLLPLSDQTKALEILLLIETYPRFNSWIKAIRHFMKLKRAVLVA
jgi:hypothetical protein